MPKVCLACGTKAPVDYAQFCQFCGKPLATPPPVNRSQKPKAEQVGAPSGPGPSAPPGAGLSGPPPQGTFSYGYPSPSGPSPYQQVPPPSGASGPPPSSPHGPPPYGHTPHGAAYPPPQGSYYYPQPHHPAAPPHQTGGMRDDLRSRYSAPFQHNPETARPPHTPQSGNR
eukprot:CAMPEP_0119138814 /NCGR_PEP_ID=MMETSP1310-20130426/26379_1 /TAXON_ID=464262 /ORGANISM="Genus nov. species nov., Strain RCC2339" /LENGTH=169 /DNA_ID=CAMNT_0007130043 /DNA_START=12 /DNA_END=517 /DNA_ORIENTATION=+